MLVGAGLLACWAGAAEAQLFGPKATVTTPGGKSIDEAQQEAYDGPKARIAVSQFKDKTGKGWWTGAIGDGMADMLSTALFHSNRYIVLERQQVGDVLREQDLGGAGRIKKGTEAPIGEIEGAELLITGAVTEFEGAASGGGGGIGASAGPRTRPRRHCRRDQEGAHGDRRSRDRHAHVSGRRATSVEGRRPTSRSAERSRARARGARGVRSAAGPRRRPRRRCGSASRRP
jgi:curli biogenesis system outer membrane secretion channel CsgG